MGPNPVLRRLGLKDTDRVVIIHTDDIGMCQSSVDAFIDLWEFGLISSGAVMVPCPWFPYAADFCRKNQQVDMGVHTTLNAEYELYRWGPESRGPDSLTLCDDDGYLPRRSSEVFAKADASAVKTEITTQVEKAVHFGIDVSHIDTHMGTVAHFKYISSYIQTAFDYHLPAMMLRKDEQGFRYLELDQETAKMAAQSVRLLEDAGLPLQDELIGLPLDQPDDRIEQAKQVLTNLKPGITHFIIHPAKDTLEIRSITTSWRSRVADYQAFCSDELKKFIEGSGLVVIGYELLRNLMREKK
jgi:chitin disaccharide deacetylase